METVWGQLNDEARERCSHCGGKASIGMATNGGHVQFSCKENGLDRLELQQELGITVRHDPALLARYDYGDRVAGAAAKFGIFDAGAVKRVVDSFFQPDPEVS